MSAEGAGDVGLAEPRARLPQVAAVRAQERDLPPRQPRGEHEPVERVVFGAPVDDGEERLLEQPQRRRIDHRPARRSQPEPLHPTGFETPGRQLVGMLVVDDDTHVRQPRQHLRQRRLPADAVQLEIEVIDADREPGREGPGRAERLEQREIGERFTGVEVVAVRGRERVGPHSQRVEAGLLALGRDQRIAQVVDPSARGRGDELLQLRDVDGVVFRVLEVEHVVQTGEHRVREAGVPLVALRPVRVDEKVRDAFAHLRGVPVAGNEHEARDEAAVRLAVDEQPDAPPFLEAEDAHRDVVEVVDVDLEEVVARIRLEGLDEVLVVVARGEEPRALDDRGDLATQHRHRERAAGVRARRVQPDEPVFADDVAVRVVALDTDVVEVCRPVDGRARVRLREDQAASSRAPWRAPTTGARRSWPTGPRALLATDRARSRRRGATGRPR